MHSRRTGRCIRSARQSAVSPGIKTVPLRAQLTVTAITAPGAVLPCTSTAKPAARSLYALRDLQAMPSLGARACGSLTQVFSVAPGPPRGRFLAILPSRAPPLSRLSALQRPRRVSGPTRLPCPPRRAYGSAPSGFAIVRTKPVRTDNPATFANPHLPDVHSGGPALSLLPAL